MTRDLPLPQATGAGLALPVDIRLMNAVSATIFALAGAGALFAALLWLMRTPLFPVRAVQVEGDLSRNGLPVVHAQAAARLAGNFFGIDLQQGRRAFQDMPWVRRAVVRRVWPDRLAVRLEEHVPAAIWDGEREDSSDDKLVNDHGELFDADSSELDDERLPHLAGPAGSAAHMLALVRRLQPVFAAMAMDIERLGLSTRGSWRVELRGAAASAEEAGSATVAGTHAVESASRGDAAAMPVVELGRGSDDELLARTERFARTFAEATSRWKAPLEYADLRHTDGYAVRLRGIVSVAAASAAAAAAPVTH